MPLYYIRALGGFLYLAGFVIMLYNIYKTIASAPQELPEPVFTSKRLSPSRWDNLGAHAHRKLEGLPTVFTILTFIAVGIGTFIELVPTFLSGEFVGVNPFIKPYTGLQLHGRDIYVREGCYLCHSQMIRPIASETLRYGEYSRAEESMYDHPFQWGSKRTGPDLARVGGKYPDLWHFRHMKDPRELSPGSIMPSYPWLFRDRIEFALIQKKLKVMKSMGVPYSDQEIETASQQARREAEEITLHLEKEGIPPGNADKEIIALIAYLQRLGQDFKKGLVR